jgi:hypothetical protein
LTYRRGMKLRAVPLACRSFAVALSLLAAGGCSADPGGKPDSKPDAGADSGADAAPPKPSFDYPLDAALRLNHIQTKGTHNSYHVETEGNIVPAWAYSHVKLADQLSQQGVRSLELDVHYSTAAGEFRVFHEHVDEATTCPTFVACLEEIKGWSDAHPAHHALFVQIEPKDVFGTIEPALFFEKLEAEILKVWPKERIITPAAVQGSSPSLAQAVAERGFPTLGEGRGKILFAMDNRTEFRDEYTHHGADLDGRLIFVDSRLGEPFGAVAILNDPGPDAEAIKASLAAGFLVRTRADADSVEPLAGDTSRREAALASGAQIVSTDYPAATPTVPYTVDIPGGTPSRCDPVNAPAMCTSEAVEDPAFINASSATGGP